MSESGQAPDQTHVETPVDGVPVIMFEGDLVTDMEARLPALSIGLSEGYERNTHLRLNVEFRVKHVRYEENSKGELRRVHVLGFESATMVAAFKSTELADTVGGSASGTPTPTSEDAAELGGLQFGRTSDTWEKVT